MNSFGLKETSLIVFWFMLSSSAAEQQYTSENMPGAKYYDGKKINLPISTQAGLDLYERWATQGLSSLISAIAQKESKSMMEYHRNKLFKCSKVSETIHEHSQCVFSTIDEAKRKPFSRAQRLDVLNTILNDDNTLEDSASSSSFEIFHPPEKEVKGAFQYRSKRDVIRSNSYKLQTEYEHMTPFGILGKYFSKTLNALKGKDENQWDSVMDNLHRLQKKKKAKEDVQKALRKKFKFAKYGARRIIKTSGLSKVVAASFPYSFTV